MNLQLEEIFHKNYLQKEELIVLLNLPSPASNKLYQRALEIKTRFVGRKVYFRGLIEYSNLCAKNCFYCGIRSCNTIYHRYTLTNEEVLAAAMYAYTNRFASIVIQSGENHSNKFIDTITYLLREIQKRTAGSLHVTLSLGEQKEDTYREWKEAGAHRYLLRIEASNPALYQKLHPKDGHHTFEARLEALAALKRTGYQVGTGVMIGLPFQTIEDLADDLLFFRSIDIDMVGMGPYIEHPETPLYAYHHELLSLEERLELSLKMVAILRLMMKNINIAATTAMQTIDPSGRERALLAGANVMMPNLTPVKYKERYLLYENKPGLEDDAEESKEVMEENIHRAGDTIAYGEWGDSVHYQERENN